MTTCSKRQMACLMEINRLKAKNPKTQFELKRLAQLAVDLCRPDDRTASMIEAYAPGQHQAGNSATIPGGTYRRACGIPGWLVRESARH